MHFDALTLACVAAELRQTIGDGRVQQVLAPDEQSIELEIYAHRQRFYLLIVAAGQAARVHLVTHKLRRGVDKPSPLMLLLRKYGRGSRLLQVMQSESSERVLLLQLEHPEHGATRLIIELLGQRSNVVLTNESGRILDCLQRVWPGETVSRPLVPGQTYAPPPPQDKLPPLDDGSADYYARLAQVVEQDGKLWRALVAAVAGVSPSLGRELAWRAAGSTEAAASGTSIMALVQALQELWNPVQTGAWQPGLWRENGELVGFSPYEAHVHGDFVPTESMSEALEKFYLQQDGPAGAPDAYAGLRASVAAALQRAEKRVERQLQALAGDEPAPGEAAALRTQAEWLLALSSQIEPRQAELVVDLGDDTLRIALDPTKSPVEQAERMFKRAGRMERAERFIPTRRAKLYEDRAFLAQLSADLAMAENQPEIATVGEELAKSGLLPARQKSRPPAQRAPVSGQPRRFLSPQGFEIVVGRNARQNEQVTFEIAGNADLWLHMRDQPGSHVVVRSGGQPVSEETLRMAAQLAAYFSSARGERAAVVAYTPRRNVTRAGGGRPGQVYVRTEKTITVRAELPEEIA